MNNETLEMFVALNKQLADVVELISQANKTSEEALKAVRELVDVVVPPTPHELK